ncbi:Sphingosine N-acyltransferase lag1 isoform B [Neolecta irregularis DAH-3]|uniref:Sphingosine N-acyltransferase lag1 isoform A n=1 Tax=Neolecta irregularis (strain DAH-3) TaxID=1198029 RepID=A0A1U7LTD2_NEOID|nr:Sphingosine N-acyltransferase lag1 isoform A [Neolecta irregularis DAH-3]OLL25803.1 Sphingosine N-acyltransferase lag1 isoform B [Neolecta irregularis DAH-3]|eukprot:OLL25802.1 Sphingosine N-acyltransferase lag1 isoform A [Neolecta irregularis DAH-3]
MQHDISALISNLTAQSLWKSTRSAKEYRRMKFASVQIVREPSPPKKPKPKSTLRHRAVNDVPSSTNYPVIMSFFSRAVRYTMKNEMELSATALLILLALNTVSPEHGSSFFHLSYYDPGTDCYLKGLDDAKFIFTCILGFTFSRAVVMEFFLIRFARWWGIGLELFVFYRFLTMLYSAPYWMNVEALWSAKPPTPEIPAFAKLYYLMQTGFWLQQILVLNMEERRKDHVPMFGHHLLTCSLIILSYAYNFTEIGHVVFCTMDFADIFLALAKCLKYMNLPKLCDVCFGLFTASWVLTRHIIFGRIIYSAIFHAARHLPYQWAPDKGIYFTSQVHIGFICLLVGLQTIICYWFFLIIKIIIKVLRGGEVDDDRSEDEDSPTLSNDSIRDLDTTKNGPRKSLRLQQRSSRPAG